MKKTKDNDMLDMSEYSVSDMSKYIECHKIWHLFYDYLIRTFGKDLYSEWVTQKIKGKNGKAITWRYRNYNEYELSKRLCGYDVMMKIRKYVKRYLPQIKIINCDDAMHAGSDILLIPHPKHGITVMYIPQISGIQNQFFLYDGHYDMLMTELMKMKEVYKNSLY